VRQRRYRGITVKQAGDLRVRLRDAGASFRVVKNTLTERAADAAGSPVLKTYLGPVRSWPADDPVKRGKRARPLAA